jgi:hypothetical protein
MKVLPYLLNFNIQTKHPSDGTPMRRITFAQLDAATKEFSLEARIGEGSFGTVYPVAGPGF